MKSTYRKFAYRAKELRNRHRISKREAAWCVLWLAGAEEESIPALVDEMDRLRRAGGANRAFAKSEE